MSEHQLFTALLKQLEMDQQEEKQVITPGIRKMIAWGLVKLDPEEGLAPTALSHVIRRLFVLVDYAVELALNVLIWSFFGWLVELSPLYRLFPAFVTQAAPLWQLGAVVGVAGMATKIYVTFSVMTVSFSQLYRRMLSSGD